MDNVVNYPPPSHGGNLHEEAQRIGVGIEQLLDASASLVPFGPPKALHKHLVKAITSHSLKSYPDRSHLGLREAIGNWHNIDPMMVLPGNGASELFTWAARDAAMKGLSALPTPGFLDYERALRCWNGSFTHLPLPLSWSAQALQSFPLKPKANVLWITNPHNPTGQLWSRASIEPLLNNHELVICDEAFLPLVPNGENQSILSLVVNHPNLIVIRSLTKLFGIAGLRLGYAIGSPERLKNWQDWRDPWPLNGLAISAGIKLMNEQSTLENWLDKVQAWVGKENPWLYRELQEIPNISPKSSSVNFLLIESHSSLLIVRKELAKRKILVRDCRSFRELGEKYLRISLQTRRGNHRIVKALRDILS